MRQYFLGPIKRCLQDDQKGPQQTGQAPLTSAGSMAQPTHWPALSCDCCLEKSLTYWKCHRFTATSLPKLLNVSRAKPPFLLQQGTGQVQRCKRWGWRSPPGFASDTGIQDKRYNGSQRFSRGWAGEVTARSFEAPVKAAGMTHRVVQAQDFTL